MLILYNSYILYCLMKCDSIESLTSPMNAVETQNKISPHIMCQFLFLREKCTKESTNRTGSLGVLCIPLAALYNFLRTVSFNRLVMSNNF